VPQRRNWQLGGGGGGSLALPRAAHLAGGWRWQQRVIDVQRLWYAR